MEQTMRGVVALGGGKVVCVNDIPMPEPDDYACLVKVHTCGFCNGTDMQIIHGTITEKDGMMPFPTVLGHEGVGEVISIGKKVRHIALGDRFIRPDTPKYYGKYSCTFGTMAEYAFAIDRQAMIEDGVPADQMPDEGKCGKIPNDISFADGAVMLSMLECVSAVHNFGLRSGMDVLIYGAGPMGMGVAAYLKIIGARVTLVDGVEPRLDYASKYFHVDRTVNFRNERLADVCKKHSFDAVMDLVGSTKVLMEGTDYLKQGGTLCSMGVLKMDDSMLEVSRLQNNTRLHMLNFPYQRMDYIDELVGLVRAGKLDLKRFYSHVLPPERINDCVGMIKSKEALKVVISFD